MHDRPKSLSMWLRHGGNQHAVSEFGQTIGHVTTSMHDASRADRCLKIWFRHGGFVHAVDDDGYTIGHHAVGAMSYPGLLAWLEAGGDPHAIDAMGHTIMGSLIEGIRITCVLQSLEGVTEETTTIRNHQGRSHAWWDTASRMLSAWVAYGGHPWMPSQNETFIHMFSQIFPSLVPCGDAHRMPEHQLVDVAISTSRDVWTGGPIQRTPRTERMMAEITHGIRDPIHLMRWLQAIDPSPSSS
jgi:hypothetical protein